MYALAPDTPAHALPRVRSRAQMRARASGRSWPSARGCKTASKKISSFSRSRTHARCAPASTAPREFALFLEASVSGATHYNYYRSYQAAQGRYTQNDPIGLDGGWNRFGYVEGNPLSYIDPLGLKGGASSFPTTMYRQPALPYMPTPSPGPQPAMPSWYRPSSPTSSPGGYPGRNELVGNLGDAVGAATGGGAAGRHPSVPNGVESLIDPQRRNQGIPWIPLPSPMCRYVYSPTKSSNACSPNDGWHYVCGPMMSPLP
jgi:RHS repeat-associated protein